jgi:hypothetical protein
MKQIASLLVVGTCLFPLTARGAETAHAKTWCLSLRFQQAMDQNNEYSLDLTTLTSGVNGELTPSGGSYTHAAWVLMTDTWFGGQVSGTMYLNVPDTGDADGDGFNDFFEVSQPISTTSSGTYNFPGSYGSGTVRASWGRAAGSHWGNCVLRFRPSDLYDWEVFSHSFEVIEYTGPLSYTPGSSAVNCSLSLTQTDNPGPLMQGPAQFVKVVANRFNQLTLQPGNWTNESLQTLTYDYDTYYRDAAWPTNYYGYLDFYDPANPSAYYPFGTWILSIDDTNDVNHNTIPDFSDDPQSTLPSRPSLTLRPTATNLWLTIRGDTGHVHQVQESLSLPASKTATNWQTVLSVTLTNSPQDVSLPLPSSTTRFWQVRAQ